MSPMYDRSQAKESGFAQVREAMIAFEGDVIGIEEGQWGGQLLDESGKQIPPKEYLEIKCTNVKVLEVSEELTMIPAEWNFRVNASMSKGSFWVDEFLKSADDNKIQMPDGLIGKRILWRRKEVTYKIKGKEQASHNFVIDKVLGNSTTPAPTVVKPATTASPSTTVPVDLMAIALEIAYNKTEAQFRSVISLHPAFVGSPLLPLAKTGSMTASLVAEGKLKIVDEGGQKVYKKP